MEPALAVAAGMEVAGMVDKAVVVVVVGRVVEHIV